MADDTGGVKSSKSESQLMNEKKSAADEANRLRVAAQKAAAAQPATVGQQTAASANVRSEPTNVRSAPTNVRSAPTDVRGGPAAAAAASPASAALSSVMQQIQQPPPAAASVMAPPPTVNTAAANPDVAFALAEQRKRYAGDNGAQTAVDLATSNARDVGTGLMREAAAGRSSRGVGGTGVDRFQTGQILGGVQKEAARATTQIGLDRENAKDQSLRDITSGGAQQASIQRGQQDVALRQWEGTEQIRQREEDAVNARQQQLINLMMQLSMAA